MASRKKAHKARVLKAIKAAQATALTQPARSRHNFGRAYSGVNMMGGHRNLPSTEVGPSEFFTFVVRCSMGDWRYVKIRDGYLYTGAMILQYFHGVTADMLDLWKRVALDHAIEFEDTVDPTTLRLVKVHLTHEDHTASLFSDADDYQHHRKLATVGKLTDEESRLMSLESQRALFKMLHSPEEQSTDMPMLKRIMESAKDCDQTVFLNGLT